MNPVFTVGHSKHTISHFVSLLEDHGIKTIADVRSVPYSRHFPQFGREALASSLKSAGVAYEFLGLELGARSRDPSVVVDGKISYELLATTPLFKRGISRIVELSTDSVVAIMCAEADPLSCHRTFLVAPALIDRGAPIVHLQRDGTPIRHADLLSLLPSRLGMKGDDLFTPREQVVAEAIRQQVSRISPKARD